MTTPILILFIFIVQFITLAITAAFTKQYGMMLYELGGAVLGVLMMK